MGQRLVNGVVLARTVSRQIHEKHLHFLAGGLAYHTFISLLPLLLVLLVIASTVGSDFLSVQVVLLTQPFLTPDAQQLLTEAVTNAAGRTGALAFGLITLAWSAFRIFRGLDFAFAEIYQSREKQSVGEQLRDGIVAFGSVGLALLAAVSLGAVVALFPQILPASSLSILFLVAGLAVAFFSLYYIFPNTDVSVREVFPGTAVAVVGWSAFQVLFQVYVQYAPAYRIYGVIGAVIILLVWIYFTMFIVLVGALINAVLAGKTQSRGLTEYEWDAPARYEE